MTIKRYQIFIILISLAILVSVVIFSRESETSVTTPPTLALTFDDGPKPYGTKKILAILKEKNIKVTFFIVGRVAAKYPELLREIDKEGHEIAIHTYNHVNLTYLSGQEIAKELESTRQVIRSATQKDSFLFRPPNGRHNTMVRETARGLGYRMILWDYYPRDMSNKASAEKIFQRMVKNVKGDGIILMHNGIPATMSALPRIIDEFRSQGYQFVTVSEFIALPKTSLYASLGN